MKRPYQHIAGFVSKNPKIIAAVVVIWFLISLFGMTQVSMKTGDDTYIDKTTPRGILLDDYKELFSSDSIMVIFESDSITDPDYLSYMDRMMRDFSNERGVKSVSGIVDMIKSVNNGEIPKSDAEINEAKSKISSDILEKYLPSNMLTIGIITLDTGISDSNQEALLNSLETIIEISDSPPGSSVTLSGNPAFQKQMSEEMGKSTGVLIVAAMLLMILAVGILFANVSYRFLPVGIVFVGLINTFGIMGIFGIPVSMVVIAAFPVLIGIGIDYAQDNHILIEVYRPRKNNVDGLVQQYNEISRLY